MKKTKDEIIEDIIYEYDPDLTAEDIEEKARRVNLYDDERFIQCIFMGVSDDDIFFNYIPKIYDGYPEISFYSQEIRKRIILSEKMTTPKDINGWIKLIRGYMEEQKDIEKKIIN